MNYNTKNNKSALILFFIFILIMVGAVALIKFKNNNQNKTKQKEKVEEKIIERTLKYDTNEYLYEIEQRNDNFEVIIKQKEECSVEPCSPTRVDDYKITKEQEINDLKEIFDELFNDTNESILSITRNDLSIDQATILEELLREPIQYEDLKYTILKTNSNIQMEKAGYTIEPVNDKYIITIYAGYKPHPGYDITINKITGNQEIAYIYVSDIIPSSDLVYTQEIVYPNIQIEFNILPKTLKIINSNDESVYQELTIEKEPTTPIENPLKEIEFEEIENSNYAINKTKGYVYQNKDGYIYLTIMMGQKNTGGYGLEVTKVEGNEEQTLVYVNEISPNPDDTVTQALTYPLVKIKFKTITKKIIVKNQNNIEYQAITKEK